MAGGVRATDWRSGCVMTFQPGGLGIGANAFEVIDGKVIVLTVLGGVGTCPEGSAGDADRDVDRQRDAVAVVYWFIS